MNRKQRVKMIVRVLLTPFTRDPFSTEDLMLKSALLYQRRRDCKGVYPQLVKSCEQARNALRHSILEETTPERLGELTELLETFYPEHKLAEHLDRWGDRLEGYYFATLLRLSEEMITLRDGRVAIKMWETPYHLQNTSPSNRELFPDSSGLYKVELWSEISRVITPDILIAGYFVQCGIDDPRYLQNLPSNIFLGDTPFLQIDRRGIAETHLHLNAGMSYLSIWEAVTDVTMWRSQFKADDTTPRETPPNFHVRWTPVLAGWLRLMMASFLQDSTRGRTPLCEYDFRRGRKDSLEADILRGILSDNRPDDIDRLWRRLSEHQVESLSILRDVYGIESERGDVIDMLLRGPYRQYRGLQTSPELLLLFFALSYTQSNPGDTGFQRVFLCYLRIKNEYFGHKLQSTGMNGLAFFREHFAEAVSALRSRTDNQAKRLLYLAAFRNQFNCLALQKLEVKISPPQVSTRPTEHWSREYRLAIAKQLSEVFRAYLTVLDEAKGSRPQTACVPTLGVVYHLIRGNIYDLPEDVCWLTEEPAYPGDGVSNLRKQYDDFVHALQYLLCEIPHLSEYVVGLDVASEELYAEPWVYAPVYHTMRNRRSTYPIQLETRNPIQNIGFTYHVGEDYHHVISGLRHIDEVLTHFGYKAGDRLGHGLALHMDLAEWLHNNEVVSIPVMEHFENLLWLWSLCSEDAEHLGAHLPELEKEIMDISSEIYTNIKGLTPYVLWSAYNKKFQTLEPDFCAQMSELYLNPADGDRPHWCHDVPAAQRSFCGRAWHPADQPHPHPHMDYVWDADKLLLTHYCPVYTRRYRQPRFIFNSGDKLPFYRSIQEYVRRKVQDMGVFVETNPTSNLLIGDVRGLSEYPITELNNHLLQDQSTASVLLSINSDDPLLFNTNVENELALVYHVLVHRGISREQVIAWIDKIRQYGIDSSFIREAKDPVRQHCELEKICARLDEQKEKIIVWEDEDGSTDKAVHAD